VFIAIPACHSGRNTKGTLLALAMQTIFKPAFKRGPTAFARQVERGEARGEARGDAMREEGTAEWPGDRWSMRGWEGTELKGEVSSPHLFYPFCESPRARARARFVFRRKLPGSCVRASAAAFSRHVHAHTCQSLIPFSSKRKLWTLYLPSPYTSLNTTAYSAPRIMYYAFATPNTRACASARLYTRVTLQEAREE